MGHVCVIPLKSWRGTACGDEMGPMLVKRHPPLADLGAGGRCRVTSFPRSPPSYLAVLSQGTTLSGHLALHLATFAR